MSEKIKLNFDYYPLVVGQIDKYTFSDWKIEGGNVKLEADLSYDNYKISDISWSSSNVEVATVEQGKVHALTTGITVISAELPNGDCAKCIIQVIDNPGRLTCQYVTLNTNRLVLNKTEGAVLYPYIMPADYFKDSRLDNSFTWESSDESIAIVNSNGRIYAKDEGKVIITATSNDVGRKVTCEVCVVSKTGEQRAKELFEDMDGGNFTLTAGDKIELKLPEIINDQQVSWCSENEAIASVDDTGKVTTYASGNINIWATIINGGFRVKYDLKINKLPIKEASKVVFSKNELHLAIGEQAKVYAAVLPALLLEKKLLWRSADESILKIVDQKINLSGLDEITVEAVGEGKTILTGALEGQSGSCNIIVQKVPKNIEMLLLPEEKEIEPEEIIRLNPAVNKDATDDDIIWFSDNKSVCTIDRDGVIKGYTCGEASVYCVAKSSLSVLAQYKIDLIMEDDNVRDDEAALRELHEVLDTTVFDMCNITVKTENDYIYNLHVPREGVTDNSILLLWNRKSLGYLTDFKEYRIYDNDIFVTATNKIGYTVKNLKPNSEHTFEVKAVNKNGDVIGTRFISSRTNSISCILDVTKPPYNAVGNGKCLDTIAIQRAIDDCPKGGAVYLPEGYVFHSGALFLKSDMTFEVDGILFGSSNPEDYPKIVCRWEGRRKLKLTKENYRATYPVYKRNVYAHASLINVGVYDEGEPGKLSICNTKNVKILGKGMINGNGFSLAHNEGPCWYVNRKGLPVPQSPKTDQNVRGRVIAIYNTREAYISDVTVAYGPAWTIHPVFSDKVTINNVKVISMGNGRTGVMEGMLILNGDGIDPDSSTNVNIVDCYFTVGDDAVAIKSGRNRQGNELDKPSAYIRISDCKCIDSKGSFCIGSEQSGGVHDVLFENLYVENIMHFGLWIKSAPSRGGLVENIIFKDCILKNTGGAVQIEYAHGGNDDPAEVLPVTRKVKYENINFLAKHKFGVRIMGHEDSPIYDVSFKNCHFGEDFLAKKDGKFVLKNCNKIDVSGIHLPDQYKWE